GRGVRGRACGGGDQRGWVGARDGGGRWPRRMKAQADGDLFLPERVHREEEAAEEISEQVAPMAADVFELALEGLRRRDGRRPQHVDEVLVGRPESRS